MKLVKYIFLTTILFLSFQKSYANCGNLVYKYIDGFSLVSENLLNKNENLINGISISPKKFFCIFYVFVFFTLIYNDT